MTTAIIGRSGSPVAPVSTGEAARIEAGRKALLDWYDKHKRDLPWRKASVGGKPDPYRIWVSEVMLQQTTVPHATPYFERFMSFWPSVLALAAADEVAIMAEWAGLGYYSRARNLIKCARIIASDYNGIFPSAEIELLNLPGFGPYTAAAVMAFAYGVPANVVDGNIERIMSRLYAMKVPLPGARGELRELAGHWIRDDRPADWPQALMDLASLVCRPRSPLCDQCPLSSLCAARAEGQGEAYPRKTAKAAKPQRYGVVFVIECEDGVLVQQRSDKGLLGGMLGLPHTPWGETIETQAVIEKQLLINAPCEVIGTYRHVFTHFSLTQTVWRQTPDKSQIQALLRRHNDLEMLPRAHAKVLPTVFRKALAL